MRTIVGALLGLLLTGWHVEAGTPCGQAAGDVAAMGAVSSALEGECDCCALGGRLGARRCARRAIHAAVRSGALRKACKGVSLRAARGRCEQASTCLVCQDTVDCPPGQYCECAANTCGGGGRCQVQPQVCIQIYDPVCGCDRRTYGNDCSRRAAGVCSRHAGPCEEPPGSSTTTSTLPAGCAADGHCDDGNGCTSDRCVEGVCQHECLCLGPAGVFTCCPGPAAVCGPETTTTTLPRPCGADCRYHLTCGWPVCPVPGGATDGFFFPDPGAAPCTTEEVGQACAVRDATCNPKAACGELLRCTDVDPILQGCPISQRRYKRDIRYLTAQDAAQVEAALLRFPLARYRYTAEDPAAPEHLGFIIDDVGPSPAVGPGGERVDLYGYTTMAVAAIQAQAHELRALRAEVTQLRQELGRACSR